MIVNDETPYLVAVLKSSIECEPKTDIFFANGCDDNCDNYFQSKRSPYIHCQS